MARKLEAISIGTHPSGSHRNLLGHLMRPDSAATQPPPVQVNRQANNMMNQAQIRTRQARPPRPRALHELGVWRDTGAMPFLNLHLDLGRHQQIGTASWHGGTALRRVHVPVVAATVVLGAITAAERVRAATSRYLGKHIPLREGLIASNMSPLAGLAPVPGLGVALAGRTTTRTGHLACYEGGRAGVGRCE